MKTSHDKTRAQPFAQHKVRDRAFMLPLVGLILLLPPFADIFRFDASVFGWPFTALYLFFVWALLILGAALLSRQLRDRDEYDENSDAAPD